MRQDCSEGEEKLVQYLIQRIKNQFQTQGASKQYCFWCQLCNFAQIQLIYRSLHEARKAYFIEFVSGWKRSEIASCILGSIRRTRQQQLRWMRELREREIHWESVEACSWAWQRAACGVLIGRCILVCRADWLKGYLLILVFPWSPARPQWVMTVNEDCVSRWCVWKYFGSKFPSKLRLKHLLAVLCS